jgi:putative transposase
VIGGKINDVKSLSHNAWECKYHVVWIPKCRKKQLYGGVAKYLESIFPEQVYQGTGRRPATRSTGNVQRQVTPKTAFRRFQNKPL